MDRDEALKLLKGGQKESPNGINGARIRIEPMPDL